MSVPVAHAQSDIQLISTESPIRLTPQLKVFRETREPLSLFQVVNRKDAFTWQAAGNPNYGFTNKGVWLHASMLNVTDKNDWVIDVAFSQLEKVDFYVLSGDRILAQSNQGKMGTTSQYRLPTLKVTLPYAQSVDLFIRIENSQSSLLAPIDIQTADSHDSINFYDNLLWGLFYGGLIMLGAYNLLLYSGFKDKSLLAYMGYICSVLIWQFVWGGHLNLLASPNIAIWIGQHVDLIFIGIGLSSGIFACTLLNAKHTAPKNLKAIQLFIGLFCLLAVLGVMNVIPQKWQNLIVSITCLMAMITYTYAGFESYANRFYPARFFIIAWCILTGLGLIGFFHLVGFVHANLFTSYCVQAGLFIQACLFSVALVDKNQHRLQQEVEQATHDLTNNIELIEEQNVRLDIARKEAVAASHVKSQFLANMSHEIRTPLNAILGFSQELRSAELPLEKQEQVGIINAAADNLLNIVNDVLDFSKIEAGKLKINNHPFSPNQVLEDVVSIMAKSAQLQNLEFIFNLNTLPEKLIGDSFRIKQVLNNLIGNALKFTDSGYISLTVEGNVKDHGIFELILIIEDSGIGISREDQRKLFAAFSQVDDALSRSYQGTGLGLVICQELVKMMHGELTLKSTPKVGSTFTVSIRTNLLNTTPSINIDKKWQDKNVVLFDPLPMSRQCGVRLLKALGANVTGVESLTFLRTLSAPQDYIFVCVPANKVSCLPNIIETLRHLKSTKTVLFYSGKEALSGREGLSQHFDNRLRLPLTLGKLNSLSSMPTASPVNKIQKRLEELPVAKVLAVDDMEMNLRLLTTWLKSSNLDLTTAYSGKDAVHHCQQQGFDLILMDVQMPGMDGLEATKLIRQTPLNLGTPIIAVTAHAFKEEQDKLLMSGMDDYLPKPINLSDLIDLIKRWCQVTDPINTDLVSFDWDLALVKANQNHDAAQDILYQFIQQLPELIQNIKTHHQQQDFDSIQSVVHQLHGACCYTGVPALHSLCEQTESALKQSNQLLAEDLLPKLYAEALNVERTVKQRQS